MVFGLLIVGFILTIIALGMYVCFLREQLLETDYKVYQLDNCIDTGKLLFRGAVFDLIDGKEESKESIEESQEEN